MKKLLKILLLPALAFTFSSKKLEAKADEKKGVTFEIVNASPYSVQFVKGNAKTRRKLTVKRDFVIGIYKKVYTGIIKKDRRYYGKEITADPNEVLTVNVDKSYSDAVLERIKIRYDKPGLNESVWYPCGVIMKDGSIVRITIYKDSINTCIRAKK